MSTIEPLFFVDVHPEYQAGFDFAEARRQGYVAAIVKASQGGSFVPGGLQAFVRRAQNSGLIVGLYHFLEAGPSGREQAAHFLRTAGKAGGPGGKVLCVDFEHYAGGSPSNAQLEGFVAEVKRRTGQPVVLYTNKGFWEGGYPSGSFRRYGADALWVARYANLDRQPRPRAHYQEIRGWSGAWESVGGRASDAWQFTSTGLVGGQYVDVNAWRHSLQELRDLAKKGEPAAPARPPKEEPVANHDKALSYMERIIGAPYSWWTNALQGLGPKAPAWASDAPPPDAAEVKKAGVFCAGVGNLGRRACGLPYLRNGIYPGGTGAWGRLPSVPFDLAKLRRGDVLFRPYRNTTDQGHWAVATGGADDPVIQSFATSRGTVFPGVTKRYTARESHDGGYYTRIIRREVAWS